VIPQRVDALLHAGGRSRRAREGGREEEQDDPWAGAGSHAGMIPVRPRASRGPPHSGARGVGPRARNRSCCSRRSGDFRFRRVNLRPGADLGYGAAHLFLVSDPLQLRSRPSPRRPCTVDSRRGSARRRTPVASLRGRRLRRELDALLCEVGPNSAREFARPAPAAYTAHRALH
jgi:hypothetical protein